MTNLARLDPRSESGYRAVIETPQGSRNKLKFNESDEYFEVACSLPAGMSFPFDFGFIPQTKCEDGDPLDVLVLMDGPAYPGCTVEIRLLGVVEAEQTEKNGDSVRNDRLIATVNDSTERGDLRKLTDLQPQLLDQIEAFFATYSGLRGKKFKPLKRRGPKTAEVLVRKAAITG